MKKWILIAVAALVVIGAAVGVIIGVTTHEEPGFMEVCWHKGQAVYTNCPATKPLKWDKKDFPLTVNIKLDKENEVYRESIQSAMKMWNSEIGTTLFLEVKSENPKVLITWGSKSSDAGGYTSHKGDGSLQSAEVQIVEASDVAAVYRFAAHELGHVLGLAHDDFKSSVMYFKAQETSTEVSFVLPSDYDKKILQEAYR